MTNSSSNTFKRNRLSVDPMVFPSSKFETMANIQMNILEKEVRPQLISMTQRNRKQSIGTKNASSGIKSPRGGAKNSIFAPQNGVYNQS